MSTSHYDAIVVGSGAGGGIAAYVLALSGAKVLVLEKGPWVTKENFGDDPLRFGVRNFINQDPLVDPRTFRDSALQGDHVYVGQVLGCSQCVGGGTVHYAACSFRFTPQDFRCRDTYEQLPGADLANWPLSADELDPANPGSIWSYYDKVERLVGVAGGQLSDQADPGAPYPGTQQLRTGPYPMPGHPPAYGPKRFEDAAARLGYHPYPMPVAIVNGGYDGRPGCTYCGFCASHGCPIDAKGSTLVTALAKAVATGRCDIRPETMVTGIDVRGGRASGVRFIDPNGRDGAVTADVVVLACSTVDTPRLVLLSDLPGDLVNLDLVGHYLMVHHYPGGIGVFEERPDFWRGFWSMRCLDDFYFGPPGTRAFGYGNLQSVASNSGSPLFAGHMLSAAETVGWGAGHKALMRASFGHTFFLGMIGQDPPVSTNMVDLDPTVRDVYGLPAARITYLHHPNDNLVETVMGPYMVEILTAMGATSAQAVLPITAGTSIPEIGHQGQVHRGPLRGMPDTLGGLLNHQMGTMRMGDHPDTSVVDPAGRFWGIPNLYAVDGSVFPSSGGYNPTLTIEANAWRIADGIVRSVRSPSSRGSA